MYNVTAFTRHLLNVGKRWSIVDLYCFFQLVLKSDCLIVMVWWLLSFLLCVGEELGRESPVGLCCNYAVSFCFVYGLEVDVSSFLFLCFACSSLCENNDHKRLETYYCLICLNLISWSGFKKEKCIQCGNFSYLARVQRWWDVEQEINKLKNESLVITT